MFWNLTKTIDILGFYWEILFKKRLGGLSNFLRSELIPYRNKLEFLSISITSTLA
jgi:hypothetical protein